MFYYPSEINNNSLVDYENLPLCDINCLKCYDNTGECIECIKLYILENNKCIQKCSDENCINCKMLSNQEVCIECKNGYSPRFNKCIYICTIKFCVSCSLKDGNEYCNECLYGYKYDKKKIFAKKVIHK